MRTSTRLGGLHISRCVHLGPDAPVSEPIIPLGVMKSMLVICCAQVADKQLDLDQLPDLAINSHQLRRLAPCQDGRLSE